MQNSKEKNYAFIDSQNLNLSILSLGWKLDFKRFRTYLKDKYHIEQAYLFIGYVEGNQSLYIFLQSIGFICVFKPTLIHANGIVKGNCDAELVLHSMITYDDYDTALIVSGDGDFYCLVDYLLEKEKLKAVLISDRFKYSALLKYKKFHQSLRFMNDLKEKLEYKKKNPHKDDTL